MTENFHIAEGDVSTEFTSPLSADAPMSNRLNDIIERMGSSRSLLVGLIEYCKEPHTIEEIDAEVTRMKECDFSVYGTMSLVDQLKKVGALKETEETTPAKPDIVEVNGTQYLEPASSSSPVILIATPEGLDAIASLSTLQQFQEVLIEDKRYEHIYRTLLECCVADDGATAEQMGAAVDSDPELQDPRMFAPYFFNKMNKCGLIEWAGTAWHATDLGHEALMLLSKKAEV